MTCDERQQYGSIHPKPTEALKYVLRSFGNSDSPSPTRPVKLEWTQTDSVNFLNGSGQGTIS
jgi:hypothetical protein